MTPTSRSLELLRSEGWTVDVVEKTINTGKMVFKRDLFGCLDIIGFRNGETLVVQTTSASNISSRIKKITESPHLRGIREAGWRIEVHGWGRKKGRWHCRREDLS